MPTPVLLWANASLFANNIFLALSFLHHKDFFAALFIQLCQVLGQLVNICLVPQYHMSGILPISLHVINVFFTVNSCDLTFMFPEFRQQWISNKIQNFWRELLVCIDLHDKEPPTHLENHPTPVPSIKNRFQSTESFQVFPVSMHSWDLILLLIHQTVYPLFFKF